MIYINYSNNILLKVKESTFKYPQKTNSLFHLNVIYGLGLSRIKLLLIILGLNKNFNYKMQPLIINKFLLRLQLILEKQNWLLENSLRKRRSLYYNVERKLKLYSFYRKKFHLPCRGQRTHSNRQTMKNFSKFNKIYNYITFSEDILNLKKNAKLQKKNSIAQLRKKNK